MKKFKVTEYITPKEAELIIKACPKERDKLILRTMWETGGRIAEVLSLIPDYIDPVNNCIYLSNLKQHADKVPLKRTYLFSDSTLCHALLDFAKENEIDKFGWIFSGGVITDDRIGQVSPTYIWYLLSSVRGRSYSSDKWKRQDGLATTLGIRKLKRGVLRPAWCHLWRHGAAMNIYHRTGRLDVVKEQLGHSSIQTTEGYAALMDEDRKDIIDKS